MTSTPCQGAALDRIVALCAAMIAAFFAITVETILTIAKNVRDILQELGACCRKAGRRLLVPRGLDDAGRMRSRHLPVHADARSPASLVGAMVLDRGAGTKSPPRPMVTRPMKGSWITKSLRQRILKGIERILEGY